jgi:hypothetical protein
MPRRLEIEVEDDNAFDLLLRRISSYETVSSIKVDWLSDDELKARILAEAEIG